MNANDKLNPVPQVQPADNALPNEAEPPIDEVTDAS